MDASGIVFMIFEEFRKRDFFAMLFQDGREEKAVEAFVALCEEQSDAAVLHRNGRALFEADFPAGTLILLLDAVQSRLSINLLPNFSRNKHKLIYGFMYEKLQNDKTTLERMIADSMQIFSSSDIHIANSHMRWLLQWINARLIKSADPQMDHTKCEVGEWIESSISSYIELQKRQDGFVNDHKSLHRVAHNAAKFYDSGEYLYALQLYLDLRSYTLRMREQFNFLFIREKYELITLDNLTHLYNRFYLTENLGKYYGKIYLFINIQDFSKINMLYGRSHGDRILIEVSHALRQHFDTSLLFRFYGDQFACILEPGMKDKINSIIADIESALQYNREFFSAVTFYGTYATINDDLFDRTEYAITNRVDYRHRFIDADTIEMKDIYAFAANLTMAQKIRLALQKDKITPYFQPICNREEKVVKYEALMRIIDNDGSVMIPADFMKVLSKMYVYAECTKIMCKKTFEIFKDRDEEFSLNLSIKDIQNDHTRQFLFQLFKAYPQTAQRCSIELLETDAISSFEEVENFFEILRTFNVKTALDDFGAGFSNFAHIFNLKLDYIKLDGSIIQRLGDDPKMMMLAQTIINMVHDLNISTIAEFVSDDTLKDICHNIGVDYMQGYVFGEPTLLGS